MENKFLFIRESETEGTLLAEDGGVAIIWHNGEHLVGQCYRERLQAKDLEKSFAYAFEKMLNDSFNSSMFDFEGHDIILPSHIEDMADWLIAGREGDFLENLIYLEENKLTRKELEAQVKSFLKNVNEYYIDYDCGHYNKSALNIAVTKIEEPKKHAKKILVHSEYLQANILVYRNRLM
jgi:hypothetical protein